MDAALGWIGQIVAWFGAFIPTWTLIRATEGGVKYLRAGRTEVLGPGIHWYWPATTELDTFPVVRQVLDTSAQTLMTKDNHTVYVAGAVIYTIDDLHKYLVENYDAMDSLDDMVQTAIRRSIVVKTFEEIQAGRAAMDNRLTKDVQTTLEPFGINVEAARLTDFSLSRVITLVGNADLVNINLRP